MVAELIGDLDVERTLGLGEALELDAEILADNRARAFRADEIAAFNRLALAGLVEEASRDAVGLVLEALEGGAEANHDFGMGFGERQPFLDDLDALALQGVWKARVVFQEAMVEGGDAFPARAIPVVEHWRDDAARREALIEADAVVQLQRGRVVGAGARHLLEKALLAQLLDQHDLDAGLGERECKAKPDRAGADDDDRIGGTAHCSKGEW